MQLGPTTEFVTEEEFQEVACKAPEWFLTFFCTLTLHAHHHFTTTAFR